MRIQTELDHAKVRLPFCAFNGGRDAWVDVGNKRVGVQVLQSYLGISPAEMLPNITLIVTIVLQVISFSILAMTLQPEAFVHASG